MLKRIIAVLLLAIALFNGCANIDKPDNTVSPTVVSTPEGGVSPTPTETQTDEPPTRAPTFTPTFEPTVAPTEGPSFELYHVKAHNLNVRTDPSTVSDENIIGELHVFDRVKVVEFEDEYAKILLENGQFAYCAKEFLLPIDEPIYGYLRPFETQKIDIPTGMPVYDDEGNPVFVKCDLIDLRYLFPDAEFDFLFYTNNNITGEPLELYYIPMIQKDTAVKLQRAYEIFKADGYTIKFYDAYRPLSVQQRLFDVVQVPKWIANPATTASNHNRGGAVDITLIAEDGVELEFPTPMHTFSEEAGRGCTTWSETAKANVDYMTNVMRRCGFNPINSEWWHFADTDCGKFLTMDFSFAQFKLCTEAELKERLNQK